MTAPLTVDDFPAFFKAIHGHEPFPWQTRLLRDHVAVDGWPRQGLALPTGSGKTAAMDVALFHLALEADRLQVGASASGQARRAPVRIAFVVDRRLVVDDAHARARKLAAALADPTDPVLRRVAARLQLLAGPDAPPLIARRLRGGLPLEGDWARSPTQPTILTATVDQIGSRLLFRGYGVSDRMKPIHAGLIGDDCLILLDEAHLVEPFRQTLAAVELYNGPNWRAEGTPAARWNYVILSATPGAMVETAAAPFGLDAEDAANPVLRARIGASKPARLIGGDKIDTGADESDADQASEAELRGRVNVLVREAAITLDRLRAAGVERPAIGVVVNRVARARAVFEALRQHYPVTDTDAGQAATTVAIELLIGPARSAEREEIVAGALDPIRTGAVRELAQPLFVVATQCIEAGVDIDLDGLVTEAAPLDALRQRFGRLNRSGRPIQPMAAIVAMKSDLAARADDAVYGTALRQSWLWLAEQAGKPATKAEAPTIDFGIDALDRRLAEHPAPAAALAAKPDAPVLMPAHLDLFAATWPMPATTPDLGLFLHGPRLQPAGVNLAWRADVDAAWMDDAAKVRQLLSKAPVRSGETIELPVWTVRRWLEAAEGRRMPAALSGLADIATAEPDEARSSARPRQRLVFRWTGDDRSGFIAPDKIRPGDTIIVPTRFGGVDRYGWDPANLAPATDVAAAAGKPYRARRMAVRLAPMLLAPPIDVPDDIGARERDVRIKAAEAEGAVLASRLAVKLAEMGRHRWRQIVEKDADGRHDGDFAKLPPAVRDELTLLCEKGRGIEIDTDIYGRVSDADPTRSGLPRGAVLFAAQGLRDVAAGSDAAPPSATESDAEGSRRAPEPMPLARHLGDVARVARATAGRAGLADGVIEDIVLAARLHDLGKADPRFQAMLAGGDPFARDGEVLLAKSTVADRPGKAAGRRQRSVELPDRWRHEALSVRMAIEHAAFAAARDPALVLWLIGSHHGRGRPLFPHADPLDAERRSLDLPAEIGGPLTLEAGHGPQSPAFDWHGRDWPTLMAELQAKYGVFGLARLEMILRLADHRASDTPDAERVGS